ncbi:MAG: hypothetical protein ACLPN6_13350 [Streptosporangiaceae bacterium]|jgi:hypothetical protein|nr:hypothetical protein [Actinomycetota bacterium]
MYPNAITWRIRLTLSDDPYSRALFHEALCDQPARVRLLPHDSDITKITGEVMVELAQDERLANLLSALHSISPQVFVTRADRAVPAEECPDLTARLQ